MKARVIGIVILVLGGMIGACDEEENKQAEYFYGNWFKTIDYNGKELQLGLTLTNLERDGSNTQIYSNVFPPKEQVWQDYTFYEVGAVNELVRTITDYYKINGDTLTFLDAHRKIPGVEYPPIDLKCAMDSVQYRFTLEYKRLRIERIDAACELDEYILGDWSLPIPYPEP